MMNEAYGYKWSSQFGDEPTDVWIGALCGVTGEQIGSALHRCKELYPVWPPGAIEFAALCEGRDPRNVDSEGNDAHWQQRWIARCDAERLAEARSRDSWLEDQGAKERAREAGAKALAEMKATLGLK